MAPILSVKYATFGQRVAAILIDTILLFVLQWMVGGALGYLIGQSMADDYANGYVTLEDVTQKATAWAWIIGIVVAWLYFSLFESSEKQATPGKMAVGLVVTDLNGDRLGFGQATGRHFSKIISSITLFIGYLAPLWTNKRQALHDIISNCLVIEDLPQANQNERDSLSDAPNRLVNDEALYLFATEEFEGPSRQAGLWAKALALHDGNEEKAKFSYIRERVSQRMAMAHIEAASISSPKYATPSAKEAIEKAPGTTGVEYVGEQGETYWSPGHQAVSESSNKNRARVSPAPQDGFGLTEKALPQTQVKSSGLSLQERSAKLDAAIKAASERRR